MRQLTLAVGLVLLAACAAQPPLPRKGPTVRLAEVTEEGTLALEDGRTVRLFGIKIPEDPKRRGEFVQALKRTARRRSHLAIREILPGEIAAVVATCWWPSSHCGNDPGIQVAEMLLIKGRAELNEVDLADHRVPFDVVVRFRRAVGRLGEKSQ